MSAAVWSMPLALQARQCLPNSFSDPVGDRHVNMGGFLRRRFPSGEAEDELTVVPDCVSFGVRPQ